MSSGGSAARLVVSLISVALVLAIVGVLAYAAYTVAISKTITEGSIVQMVFAGSPTMLGVALTGVHGEEMGTVSDQDKVNLAFCDVRGSAGLFSSWASNSGLTWMLKQPTLCSASSKQWFSKQTCANDADCYTLSHLPCGMSVTDPAANIVDWDATMEIQCGGTGANGKPVATCSDHWNGVCVIQHDELPNFVANCNTATGSSTGTCVMTNPGAACPTLPCAVDTDCYSGMTCDTAHGGTCTGTPLPETLLNVNFRAEGVVTHVNDDQTVNVAWNRVSCLYNHPGPPGTQGTVAAIHNYQLCRFIADPSHGDAANTRAAAILFGNNTGGLTDPRGFTDVQSLPEFTIQGTARSLTSVLPVGPAARTDHTGWDLASLNVPVASLTRVPDYSIQPRPVDPGVLAYWTQRVADAAAANGGFGSA